MHRILLNDHRMSFSFIRVQQVVVRRTICCRHVKETSEHDQPSTDFTPLEFLKEKPKRYAVVLLNGPFNLQNSRFSRVWNNAVYRSVTDGAVNKLKERFFFVDNNHMRIPELISGDLDSARREHLNFFRALGSRVIETPDQNAIDFTKNLRLVKQELRNRLSTESCDQDFQQQPLLKVLPIVALNAHGGRFDQQFANLNTVFINETEEDAAFVQHTAESVANCSQLKQFLRFRVLLFSGDCCSCVLRAGRYRLRRTGLEEKWCSLIPLGCSRALVTTRGLRWNVNCRELAFGDCISTSNDFDESTDEVFIESDSPLVYSTGVKPELN